MYVSHAEAVLAQVSPQSPAQQMRVDLMLQLLDDVRRLFAQTKDSRRRIRLAVKASATSVADVYGVGPVHAASLIGYSGETSVALPIGGAHASYNGAAPVEFSSRGRTVHRLSKQGSRRLNNTLHMAAVTQIRNPGTEAHLLRAQGGRREDQEGSPPLTQAPEQQGRLSTVAPRPR
jgi:transposase